MSWLAHDTQTLDYKALGMLQHTKCKTSNNYQSTRDWGIWVGMLASDLALSLRAFISMQKQTNAIKGSRHDDVINHLIKNAICKIKCVSFFRSAKLKSYHFCVPVGEDGSATNTGRLPRIKPLIGRYQLFTK